MLWIFEYWYTKISINFTIILLSQGCMLEIFTEQSQFQKSVTFERASAMVE
jgi:hypothetical protein